MRRAERRRSPLADRRVPVTSSGEDDPGRQLYLSAASELLAINERVIRVEVARQVAQEIARRDLVVRALDAQPTSARFLGALHQGFEDRIRQRNPGTYVGGWQLVREVAIQIGVDGASGFPLIRRTRAQVDAAPNPYRAREGTGRIPPRAVGDLSERRFRGQGAG